MNHLVRSAIAVLAIVVTSEAPASNDFSFDYRSGDLVTGYLPRNFFNDPVIVSGEIAYLVHRRRLEVIDLTDVENPCSIAELDISPYISNGPKAALRNGMLFLSGTTNRGPVQNVVAVDISDPRSPRVSAVTAASHHGECVSVAASGDRVYTVNRDGSVQAFRFTGRRLVHLATQAGTGYVSDGAAHGDFLYLLGATDDSITVVDFSDTGSPVIVQSVSLEFQWHGAACLDVDDTSLVVAGPGKVVVMDLATPSNPVPVGELDLDSRPLDVSIYGEQAFVSQDTNGLGSIVLEIDIRDCASPLVRTHPWPLRATSIRGTPFGFVALGHWGLHAVATGLGQSPPLISYETDRSLWELIPNPKSDYVIDVEYDRWIVHDFSVPGRPRLAGTYPKQPESDRGPVVRGDRVLTRWGPLGGELSLVDIPGDGEPRELFRIPADSLKPEGERVFAPRTPVLLDDFAIVHGIVWDFTGGWRWAWVGLDIHDATAPRFLGELLTTMPSHVVAGEGNQLLWTDGGFLHVAEMEHDGVRILGSMADSLGVLSSVSGDRAVLVDDTHDEDGYSSRRGHTVRLVDVSVPSDPELLGSVDCHFFLRETAYSDEVVYASGDASTEVLDFRFSRPPRRLGAIPIRSRLLTSNALIAIEGLLPVQRGRTREFPVSERGRDHAIIGSSSHGFRVHPLPVRRRASLEFTLPIAEPIVLELYDISGRRVSRQAHEPTNGTLIPWSALDDEGRSLPSGVYFLRATGRSVATTQKITVIR
ncbi:MAG: hypothetical protein DHS20C21_02840 [Gemmatimonadota bacterium]|nr:MAG: hypothetical protein DHS20C21_02840 [Gemmatimonadota bacterium]